MDQGQDFLRISHSEALVLFEFLSRFSEKEDLKIKAAAEEKVLWNILAQLEKSLSEPFSGRWDEILAAARKKVDEEY